MKAPKEALRIVAALPALVLVVASLGELWSATHYGSNAPEAADWGRAHELLSQKHRPGELIVFAPAWLDPVGRHHLGEWIDVQMAARMDGAGYGVVWEVSTRGATAPDTQGLKRTGQWQIGELRVRRFEQEPAEVIFDFLAELGRAAVEGSGAKRPRVVLEEVGFEPHRCIQVEPDSKEKVILRFSKVTLGSQLVGYVGLADVFTRRDIRSPATFDVRVNGETAAQLVVGIDDGWMRFVVSTETQPTAEVEFVVGAEHRRRLVCFAAEARR